MILCNKRCIPCCDLCLYAIHDEWDEYIYYIKTPQHIVGDPIGCTLHNDIDHQEIAKNCGECEDFHCRNAKEKSWYII